MKKKTTIKKGPLGTPLGNPLGYFNSQKAKRSAEPKQTLRKAQDGIAAGPLTKRDSENLDRNFPSTVTPVPMDPWYNTYSYKKIGANRGGDPVADEADERKEKEAFMRRSENFNKKKKGGVIKSKKK